MCGVGPAPLVAATRAQLFQQLLNLKKGTEPRDGRYNSSRVYLTATDIAAHLAGERVYGFLAVHRRKANFICFDCDKLFLERLHVFRQVLEDLNLASAAFATTGSNVDRGKVVITLARPMPIDQALDLVGSILQVCDKEPIFGGIGRGDKLDTYPLRGEGGIVRIGGTWKGVCNDLIALDRLPLDLNSVVPFKFKPWVTGIPPRERPGKHSRRLLEGGWARSEGTDVIFRRVVTLAHETKRLYGGEGETALLGWLSDIQSRSPRLGITLVGKKPINLRAMSANAWRVAMDSPRYWRPMMFRPVTQGHSIKYLADVCTHLSGAPPLKGVTKVWRAERHEVTKVYTSENEITKVCRACLYTGRHVLAYRKLVELCDAYGIKRLAVSKDLESIGDAIGLDKGNTRHLLRSMEQKGLIVTIDRGAPNKRNQKGRSATYALIGSGETREDVISMWEVGLDKSSVARSAS